MFEVDKNSLEFDLSLLDELRCIEVPSDQFDKAVDEIMAKKSDAPVWRTRVPRMEVPYDSSEPVQTNYRCCPAVAGPSALGPQYCFCMMVEETRWGKTTVTEAFLTRWGG